MRSYSRSYNRSKSLYNNINVYFLLTETAVQKDPAVTATSQCVSLDVHSQ